MTDDRELTLYEKIVGILGERHARELIDELWSAGYEIARRRPGFDPYYVNPRTIPDDTSYQWVDTTNLDALKAQGWQPVPASRHDGAFMRLGYKGDIEIGGVTLFERPKADTDKVHADNIAAAHKLVDDWKKQYSDLGFSGHVKVGYDEETAVTHAVGEGNAAGNITWLPTDMVEYAGEIFAERDRLRADRSPSDLDDAALTALAVDNVRQRRLAS